MAPMSRFCLYATLGAATALIFGVGPAAAEGSLDSIVDLYRNSAASWGPTLRNYALGLFGILALIEVGYSFIKMAIRGADLGDFLAELVGRMMFIGFFLWLLLNSGQFSEDIINSFRQAGNAAAQAGGGSGGVRPSDIFEAGMDMATRVMDAMKDSGWGLEQMGEKIMLGICAIVLALCFALMAAFLILALVEAYIVMSAGTLLLGFGGSRFTKDFAIKQMTYCVSVGAKLFVIQLLVGIGEAMIKSWADNLGPSGVPADFSEVMVMLGSAIVMLALTKTIPDTVQGIINGVSPGSGMALPAAAAAVGGAAAGAAASALGGGAAVSAASKLASEQGKASGKGGTGFGAVASHVGQMGKNLTGAAANDVGARLGGQAQRGTTGGRMAQSMSSKARQLSAERSKPMAPSLTPTATPTAAPAAANDGGSIRAGGGESGGGATKPTTAARSAASGAAPQGGREAANSPIFGEAPEQEAALEAPQAVREPIRSVATGTDGLGTSGPHGGAVAASAGAGGPEGKAPGASGAPVAAGAGQDAKGRAGEATATAGLGGGAERPEAGSIVASASAAGAPNAAAAEGRDSASGLASGHSSAASPGGEGPSSSKRTAKSAASAAAWPEAPGKGAASAGLGGRLGAARGTPKEIKRAPRKPNGDRE